MRGRLHRKEQGGEKFQNIFFGVTPKYPTLYDKQDKYFKDRNKKQLAWANVAKKANLVSENGESFLYNFCGTDMLNNLILY